MKTNNKIWIYGIIFLIIINIATATDIVATTLGTSTTDLNINWIGNEQRQTFYKLTTPGGTNINVTNIEFLITEVTSGGTNFTVVIYNGTSTNPNTSQIVKYSQNFTTPLSINTRYNATFTNTTLYNNTIYWIGFIPLINTTGFYRLGETSGTPEIGIYCTSTFNTTTLSGCTSYSSFVSTVNSITVQLYTNLGDSALRLSARNSSNANISNFTATINNITVSTTTNDILYFTTLGSTYYILIDAPGYAYDNTIISVDNITETYQAILYPTNTINLTIRKESDGNIIYQNTSITLQSDSGITTTTTINGTKQIESLTADNYTISATTSGYATGYDRVNLPNRTYQNSVIYLNNGTSVLFNFQTPTGSVIPGVELNIYRLVNGSTVLVQQRISDVSGIAQVSLETTGVYSFTTYIEGYNNYSFSLNPILFTSYDVVLTPTTSGNDIEPSATVQFTPTNYFRFQNVNFNIQFLSQYNSLTNYYYNITYPGGSSTGTGTNTHGESFNNQFNLNQAVQGSIVTIHYNYTLENGQTYNTTYNYSIVYINSNRTWVTLGNNINTTTNQDSITGYYVGERIIIVTFISIILFGVGWSIGGGIVGLILALMPIILFTQSGFVPKQLYYVTILFILFYIIGRGSDS